MPILAKTSFSGSASRPGDLTSQPMQSLQDLPLEIIYNIIRYVDTGDLVSVVRLNRWWATQFYETSRSRIEDMLENGWIVRNTLETMDTVENPIDTAIFGGITLVTVLDHVEPLTLKLVFNLHEIGMDGFTILPQHPENLPYFNLKYTGRNEMVLQSTFIGRNTSNNRITWINQLDPAEFVLDTSNLGGEQTESTTWKSSLRIASEPDAFVTYSLITQSIDPSTKFDDANSNAHGQREMAKGENAPFLLRLDNFVCSYKWWTSKVEEAESEAKRPVADDMNIW